MEAAAHDAELLARKYWRERFGTVFEDDACGNCSNLTDRCVGRSEREFLLCGAGSEPLSFRSVVDASVLPVLRKQLEAELAEVTAAQEAVARKMSSAK